MNKHPFQPICIRLIFLVLLSLVWGLSYAGGDSQHPVLDGKNEWDLLPRDVEHKPLEDLVKLRHDYHTELKELDKTVESKADQAKLMQALNRYDESRIQIVEVIPKLIKDYQIKGELKTTLLTYGETIRELHEEYLPKKTDLSSYKAYDFRVGMAYMSMLSSMMSTDPDLYQRMRIDMDNTKTSIGQYIAQLDQSYKHIEKVNEEVDEYQKARQLRKALAKIDDIIQSHK